MAKKGTGKKVEVKAIKKKTNSVDASTLAKRIVLDFWNNTQTIQKTLYKMRNGKDTNRKAIRERFTTVGTKFLGIDKVKANALLNEILGK